MKYSYFRWTVLVVATASFVFFTACDENPFAPKESEIPEEVVEAAMGIFDMIDEYLMVDDPTLEMYPEGVTVIADTPLKSTLTFTNFKPEDGSDTVNGTIVLEQSSENPMVLVLNADLEGTMESETIVVKINTIATWAKDADFDDGPVTTTGTFVYNGTSYGFADIMTAIEKYEKAHKGKDNNEDPEKHVRSPLPSNIYPPTQDSIRFWLIATKIESTGWEPCNKEQRLEFNGDRNGFAIYDKNGDVSGGEIDWDTSQISGKIVLNLYESNTEPEYSFIVNDYGEDFFYMTSLNLSTEINFYYHSEKDFPVADIPY